MKRSLLISLLGSLLLCFAPAGSAHAGVDDLRGIWDLNRAQSEPMREMLAAQGYNAFEIGILERIPVSQDIDPGAGAGRVTIRTRTSVVKSDEILTLDDVVRPADSPLGRVERAAVWDEAAQTLRTRLRYQARNKQPAEMWITRRRLDATHFAQETRLRLADGREFRARQVFVRRS